MLGHWWYHRREGGSQASLAQSSMASSWSARASNMVLMSSRMCLVEAAVGLLHQGKALMRRAVGLLLDAALYLTSYCLQPPSSSSYHPSLTGEFRGSWTKECVSNSHQEPKTTRP